MQLLDALTVFEDGDRRLASGPGVRELERRGARRRARGLRDVPGHDPGGQAPAVASRTRSRTSRAASGFGIGSAGLRAYTLLVEGRTQALENDVVLSMKQAQTPAASRVVTDEKIRSYFEHEGHRTAVSQGALQAHADPWVGWCELDGVGQVIKELSPYEADLDWDVVTEVDEMLPLVHDLGRATAKVHCVSDEGSEHPLVDINVEAKITDVIGGRDDEFAQRPGGVRRRVRRADARGPPPLRRRLPQRDDPRASRRTSARATRRCVRRCRRRRARSTVMRLARAARAADLHDAALAGGERHGRARKLGALTVTRQVSSVRSATDRKPRAWRASAGR